jgi:DNA topoisomerase-1
MVKNLVVVESPAKAKTIEKYLGADYRVLASIGHIKDLPSKGLGVDVEHDFEPTYEVIPDTKKRNNKKIVAALKAAAKEADAIYLAADPDREGEAICQHLAEEIVPKRPAKPTFRVMFNEITKRAVQDAFKEPKRSRLAACWTGSSATRSRRFCVARSAEDFRRVACSRSR